METGCIRKKRKNFAQVSNVALLDKKLSLKAKGLYGMIESFLSIPDFVLYKTTLAKYCAEGDTAFNKAWKELKDAGYLIQHRTSTQNGFVYEYDLLDEPTTNSPTCGFSTHGDSISGDTTDGEADTYINTQEKNINKNNIYLNNNKTNNNVVVKFDSVYFLTNIKEQISKMIEIGYSENELLNRINKIVSLFSGISIEDIEFLNQLSPFEQQELFSLICSVYDEEIYAVNKDAYILGIIKRKRESKNSKIITSFD